MDLASIIELLKGRLVRFRFISYDEGHTGVDRTVTDVTEEGNDIIIAFDKPFPTKRLPKLIREVYKLPDVITTLRVPLPIIDDFNAALIVRQKRTELYMIYERLSFLDDYMID